MARINNLRGNGKVAAVRQPGDSARWAWGHTSQQLTSHAMKSLPRLAYIDADDVLLLIFASGTAAQTSWKSERVVMKKEWEQVRKDTARERRAMTRRVIKHLFPNRKRTYRQWFWEKSLEWWHGDRDEVSVTWEEVDAEQVQVEVKNVADDHVPEADIESEEGEMIDEDLEGKG